MKKKTFTKEYLLKKDLPYSNYVFKEIVGQSRWSVEYAVVFEDEGKFYKTYYQVGATEEQMEGPWEFEDEVECTEVELKEVTVKKWVPVED